MTFNELGERFAEKLADNAVLTAELDRLRKLVEEAYREGWQDALCGVDTDNHRKSVENAGWNESEARITLQETNNDE